MRSRRVILAFYYTATLIIALYASYTIFSKSYSLTLAYGDTYISDEIYYVDTSRRILENIFGVSIQYYNYSGKTNSDYYNLEHPPLGKYIIGFNMVVCGDRPVCWRLPGVIEASLMPIILYVAYATLGSTLAPLAGAIAALTLASDPIVYRVSSIAILDIHLAFFTCISIALAVRSRFISSITVASLALAVKISGVGTLIGALMNLYRLDSIRSRIKHIIVATLIAILVALALHAPLIEYFGAKKIIDETLNAIRWHTTSRPPDGPPSSSPSGWILNVAPFIFTFNPVPVYAEVNTLIHVIALAFSLYILVLGLFGGLRDYTLSAPLFYAGIMLAYWAVFIAGNRTLYSFYAVQLAPAAAGTMAEILLLAWNRRGLVGEKS